MKDLDHLLGQACACAALVLTVLGSIAAWGPYQDARTWNLVRNSAGTTDIGVPSQEPTHFRLREVMPLNLNDGSPFGSPIGTAPPVLFIPGHGGKWTQVINIACHMTERQPMSFFSLDFHASASALHWSVISHQASFAKAAIERLQEIYPEDEMLTLLGHSMGGLVALKALLLLAPAQQQRIGSLVMICTPVSQHPLLLEPSMVWRLRELRAAVAQQSERVPMVVVSAGETDPLVPLELAQVPTEWGWTLSTASIRDVHMTFSHVNLLFSRSSLQALGSLLIGAVEGRLFEAAQDLQSPFLQLFHPLPTQGSPPGPAESWGPATSWTLLRAEAVEEVPRSSVQEERQALEQAVFEPVRWAQLRVGSVHVFPPPATAGVFYFLLHEKPRPILRLPETSTRGETFNDKDLLDCTKLVAVRAASLNQSKELALLDWVEVPAMTLQHPVKACLFQWRPASADRPGIIGVKRLAKSGGPPLKGWACWQADPILQPAAGLTLPDLLLAAFRPQIVELPSRGAVAYAVQLTSTGTMPIPLDVRALGSSKAAKWEPPVLFFGAKWEQQKPKEVQVAALQCVGPEVTMPLWAAESADGLFAPRFSANRGEATHPGHHATYVVLADPMQPVQIQYRVNLLSLLVRFFRYHLGHVLSGWLCGSWLLAHSGRRKVVLWLLASTALQAAAEAAPSVEEGIPLPLPFRVLLQLLGLGLAASYRGGLRSLLGLLCRQRAHDFGASPAASTPSWAWLSSELLFWLLVGGLSPPGAVVLLVLSSTVATGKHLGSKEVLPCLESLSTLLIGPFLLCSLPSITFTVWLLTGQQWESSTKQLEPELLSSLPFSQHAAFAVDGWLPALLLGGSGTSSFIPACGLILPSLALAALRHGALAKGSVVVGRVNHLGFAAAVVLPVFIGNSSDQLWPGCQVLFLVHALWAAGLAFSAKWEQSLEKKE